MGPPGTRPARGPLACVNEDPLNVQSTGLVLGPDGRIVVRVYSSGAIGRLVPEDVIGLIDYEREHARLIRRRLRPGMDRAIAYGS